MSAPSTHPQKISEFVIEPGPPLSGEITISGAKNSVLKLMAATVMASGTHTIYNVPDIFDVGVMCELLESMGAKQRAVPASSRSSSTRSLPLPRSNS